MNDISMLLLSEAGFLANAFDAYAAFSATNVCRILITE